MTTLTLNRSPIQKDFSESQSLNEVVDHLFASEIGEESVLISLEVDGEDIPYDDSLNLNGKPIHDFKSVNFKTQTSLELAFEAIDSCHVWYLSSNSLQVNKSQNTVYHFEI